MSLIERLIIIKRFIQSVVVLTMFLFIPTMRLKSLFVMAVAKLPVWQQYEFFRSMNIVMEQDEKSKGLS